MLQIKTIVHFGLEDSIFFDQKVNDALWSGWKLTKRERVSTPESPSRYGYLYAEMEREVIATHERSCDNCLYSEQNGGEPCDSCENVQGAPSNWEPMAGVVLTDL